MQRFGIRARLVVAAFLLTVLAGFVVERLTSRELDASVTARVATELMLEEALLEDTLPEDAAQLDRVARRFAERGGVRVTLVAEDGHVVVDSGVPREAVASLENHAGRAEILAARLTGEGTAVRPSPTLGERMIYVARRVNDAAGRAAPGVRYVRLAVPLTAVDHAVASSQRAIAVGTAVALALAAAIFGFGAHLLTGPIRALTSVARRMADGDLATRAPARGRDEVATLGRALNALAGRLSQTIDALRADHDVTSGILDGMSEGVLLLDDEHRVVLANRALRKIARIGDGGVGKPLREVIDSASLREALETVPATREVELGGVLTRRLLVRVSRLPKGDRGALLAVFHDVTDLRRLETIRTDFVANVSHELRTPVTAISTATETLLGGALEDADAAREFVEVIDRHSVRLRNLVDDLLDLAKIEAKGFRLALEDVDLEPVVEHAVTMLEATARARDAHVDAKIQHDLPPIHVDRRALEQVLSNLLENAIKYGGDRARVRVTAQRVAAGVEIAVADNGPGIPPAHLARVFERFYRVDTGRSREMGGTGLGLSIVKHLTELMQGSVEVESELGAGATFRVTLPAGIQPAPPRDASTRPLNASR